MSFFWKSGFTKHETQDEVEPAESALYCAEQYKSKGYKSVLIPGLGTGRNARPFIEKGIEITGIEISEEAIEESNKNFPKAIKYHNGSVQQMPFDDEKYDSVYCFSLLHLLNGEERAHLIKECYNHLNPGGMMSFVTLSTRDGSYGKGEPIGRHYFMTEHGVKVFFFDKKCLAEEFNDYKILEKKIIKEPVKHLPGKFRQKMWCITCYKPKD